MLKRIREKVFEGERVTAEDGMFLMSEAELLDLVPLAEKIRYHHNPTTTAGGRSQFTTPYGHGGGGPNQATHFQRYLEKYGAQREEMATVVLNGHANGQRNENPGWRGREARQSEPCTVCPTWVRWCVHFDGRTLVLGDAELIPDIPCPKCSTVNPQDARFCVVDTAGWKQCTACPEASYWSG